MPEQKPDSKGNKAGIVKKITLPDGFRVGIVNLDYILREVAGLKLTDSHTIKAELLKRAEAIIIFPQEPGTIMPRLCSMSTS